MTRLAVKTYCQQQLAALDFPGAGTVVTQRPKVIDAVDQALILVEIPESRETRFTMPRTTGNKKVEHRVRLGVYWIQADETAGGDAFDDFLEQIDGVFRAATMPANITDPDTGTASRLVFVGEQIDTSVNEPMQDETMQGMVVFSAMKEVAVTELVQG